MYRFRYSKGEDGVGQGEGNVGDVISDSSQQQGQGKQAGQEPGEAVFDVEFSVEEIIKLMLEDLKLPWLEEKSHKKQKIITTEYDDIRKKGILNNINKKRTIYENIKRNAAKGKAEFKDIIDEDLRYKTWRDKETYKSNAAVFLLMDRSGSMTVEKRYIAKSFFFWVVNFLRMKYQEVDINFIAHDVEAHIMEEKDFFTISSSGGTKCSSAFIKTKELIDEKYPPSMWNLYVFHFSDGENWGKDNQLVKEVIEELLNITNMVGYLEVAFEEESLFYGWGGLMYDPFFSTLYKELESIKNDRFIISKIGDRNEIYESLKKFLSIENEKK
jgi:hypothetical protein